MHPTRREMLRLGLGSSALLACGATVPTFLVRSASALGGDSGARILVVLQLDGGNDGLNTVVPYRDETYRGLRPTLQVRARDVRRIDDRFGFHPALERFSRLLEDGRLAVVQGVGYPNPNRSHVESMTIWQTARLDPDAATPGWLAQALDRRAQGAGPGDAPGLHVHDAFPLPRSLAGGDHLVPSLHRPDQFRRRIGVPETAGANRQREDLDRLIGQTAGAPGSLLEFMERSSLITYASSARMEALQKDAPTAPGYPEYFKLAQRLRLIAQLIKAGMTTSLYYTHLDGFDTHANQVRRHPELLRELGESLHAFLDDLGKAGEADRVLVVVFSEFGRRLAENASGGTDHGTAAPSFVLGKAVRAGLHGEHPDLEHLEDGDPRHAIDFRRLYATVLERWLQVPSQKVLGGEFQPLPLLKV